MLVDRVGHGVERLSAADDASDPTARSLLEEGECQVERVLSLVGADLVGLGEAVEPVRSGWYQEGELSRTSHGALTHRGDQSRSRGGAVGHDQYPGLGGGGLHGCISFAMGDEDALTLRAYAPPHTDDSTLLLEARTLNDRSRPGHKRQDSVSPARRPAATLRAMSSSSSHSDGDEGGAIGRRAFFGIVGVGLTSLAWGGDALDLVSQATRAVPEPLRAAVPFGQGWRIYAVNPPYPRFEPASWRLRIDGLVERPIEFTYAELRALPQAEQTSDFHCVTGWSVEGVRWSGVRFADLLAAARPRRGAHALEFVSAEEPYVDTLTLAQAMAPDAMLAHAMDGRPLTREHGAPARVVMPRMYGYKGVKWLDRIVVTRRVTDGYWEQRGYDRDAWVGGSNGL